MEWSTAGCCEWRRAFDRYECAGQGVGRGCFSWTRAHSFGGSHRLSNSCLALDPAPSDKLFLCCARTVFLLLVRLPCFLPRCERWPPPTCTIEPRISELSISACSPI